MVKTMPTSKMVAEWFSPKVILGRHPCFSTVCVGWWGDNWIEKFRFAHFSDLDDVTKFSKIVMYNCFLKVSAGFLMMRPCLLATIEGLRGEEGGADRG